MLIEAKKEASKILNVVHYEEITNVCKTLRVSGLLVRHIHVYWGLMLARLLCVFLFLEGGGGVIGQLVGYKGV